MPELQLLSNGSYHVILTASDHGASCWQGLAVTRWSEDGTLDRGGTYCYVRDDAAPVGGTTGTRRSLLPIETAEHDFRDGWTRYTGSAGWMTQFIGESLPGLQCCGNRQERTVVVNVPAAVGLHPMQRRNTCKSQ